MISFSAVIESGWKEIVIGMLFLFAAPVFCWAIPRISEAALSILSGSRSSVPRWFSLFQSISTLVLCASFGIMLIVAGILKLV